MSATSEGPAIVYCRCAFAQVVAPEVKDEVLARLAASDRAFEAVPDLCAMSARKDPALARLAARPELRVVACYPRAVRWLFHAAGAPLPENGLELINMRAETAEQAVERALAPRAAEVPA
jgi:hypothetical protein